MAYLPPGPVAISSGPTADPIGSQWNDLYRSLVYIPSDRGGFPASLQAITTSAFLINANKMTDFMRVIFMDMDVTESISTNYEAIQTIGRNIPIYGFQNTSGRTISLKLYFPATMSPITEVYTKVKWLRRFQYPKDNAKTITPPDKLTLIMGAYLWVTGVVTNVEVTWKPPIGGIGTKAGFLPMIPHHAEVSLTLEETQNFYTDGQMDYTTAERESQLGLANVSPVLRSIIHLI